MLKQKVSFREKTKILNGSDVEVKNVLDIDLKIPFQMSLQLRKLDTGKKNFKKFTWYLK